MIGFFSLLLFQREKVLDFLFFNPAIALSPRIQFVPLLSFSASCLFRWPISLYEPTFFGRFLVFLLLFPPPPSLCCLFHGSFLFLSIRPSLASLGSYVILPLFPANKSVNVVFDFFASPAAASTSPRLAFFRLAFPPSCNARPDLSD